MWLHRLAHPTWTRSWAKCGTSSPTRRAPSPATGALQEVLHPRHSVWVSGNRRVRNSFVCLFILFIPSSVSSMSAYPPTYVSVHSSVQPFIYLFVCLDSQSFVCLFFVCLFIYSFVCLLFGLFVRWSVRSFVRLFVAVHSKTGGLYLSLHALLLNNGLIFHKSVDMCTLWSIIQEYTLINNTGIHSDQ